MKAWAIVSKPKFDFNDRIGANLFLNNPWAMLINSWTFFSNFIIIMLQDNILSHTFTVDNVKSISRPDIQTWAQLIINHLIVADFCVKSRFNTHAPPIRVRNFI